MSFEKYIEDSGVILNFLVHSARLNLVEGDAAENAGRSMALDLRLDWPGDVRLSDKRSLRNVAWSMYLIEGSKYNEKATEQGAVGILWHHSETETEDSFTPETCHVGAALKPDKFLSLLLAIQNGKFPESATVVIRGMKYGWEPDGSGKEWDEKQNPHLPVMEISFHIPLFGQKPKDSDKEEQHSTLPASSADIRALQTAFAEGLATLARTIWRVFWLGAAIAVALWLAL